MEDDGNIQTIDKSGNCRQLGSETGILAPTGNGHVPSPLNQEPDKKNVPQQCQGTMKRDETGTLRRSLITTPETSDMSIGPEGQPPFQQRRWGFLKLGVPFFSGVTIRRIKLWGLYRGPLFLGSYPIELWPRLASCDFEDWRPESHSQFLRLLAASMETMGIIGRDQISWGLSRLH